MSLRKRKLDTPEEIRRVCFLYYQSDTNQEQLARHFDVSPMTIKRVLDENGAEYARTHKDEIDAFRKTR